MNTINGTYASATVFTNIIEDSAISQIEQLCSQPFVKGARFGLCRMSIPETAVLSDLLPTLGIW